MRISDWSSDVCSSDLTQLRCQDLQPRAGEGDGEDCLEPTAQFRVAGSERRTGEQQRIAVEQQQALPADRGDDQRQRPEERRVRTECDRTCSSRGWASNKKK